MKNLTASEAIAVIFVLFLLGVSCFFLWKIRTSTPVVIQYDCSNMTQADKDKAWEWELHCITEHYDNYCTEIVKKKWCKKIEATDAQQ